MSLITTNPVFVSHTEPTLYRSIHLAKRICMIDTLSGQTPRLDGYKFRSTKSLDIH